MLDKEQKIANLAQLFEQYSGQPPTSIEALPPSGSDRQYFRLRSTEHRAIGAFNHNLEENKAFLYFSEYFRNLGIAVPQIYESDLEKSIYLIEDLGDLVLLNYLQQQRQISGLHFPEQVEILYKEAIKKLVFLQIRGGAQINYTQCYPTATFNQQSMLWDCYQFKYWYLQPTHIQFNETLLEQDFQDLTNYLMKAEQHYFMFRDFQARNIMIYNNELYFIDYQGGRKGPLQYDLVSLLFQAKAAIPHHKRVELLAYYMQEVQRLQKIDVEAFESYYYGFVLLRTMQVLGAYGFKGYYQRKAHFLTSIPFALNNLAWWMNEVRLPLEIPHLRAVFSNILETTSTIKKPLNF